MFPACTSYKTAIQPPACIAPTIPHAHYARTSRLEQFSSWRVLGSCHYCRCQFCKAECRAQKIDACMNVIRCIYTCAHACVVEWLQLHKTPTPNTRENPKYIFDKTAGMSRACASNGCPECTHRRRKICSGERSIEPRSGGCTMVLGHFSGWCTMVLGISVTFPAISTSCHNITAGDQLHEPGLGGRISSDRMSSCTQCTQCYILNAKPLCARLCADLGRHHCANVLFRM